MKKLSFILFFSLLSIILFAQSKTDSVFTESEIVLKTATGDISGTLTIPNNVKKMPIILIIAGSGPTDRDCNSPMNIQTNAYKMLAEGFANKGMATLRYDKRGVGKSKKAMTGESDLRFDMYVNDAVAWISMLKEDNRFTKVIILGHSEGSLIGMIAAKQTKVAAFISLAGVGKPADKVLQDQLKGKLPPDLQTESDNILDSLRNGKTVAKVNKNLLAIYRPSVQPYMISWIKYDPSVEITKLKMPVLILQGNTDIQVSVGDAKLLAAAKPKAKLVIVENMNHILKESEADAQKNMATYKNPDLPLKKGLVDLITIFIKDEI